jgi:hypothetical protein
MQIFASIIGEEYNGGEKKRVHVAIMPGTAKKFGAARPKFNVDGRPCVNYVLTSQMKAGPPPFAFNSLRPKSIEIAIGRKPFFTASQSS